MATAGALQATRVTREAPWVRDITPDAIRHFAWGIGDANPLWLDPEYAAATRWGGVIAPPCFAYAADETTVAPGQTDLSRIYAAVEWTWWDVFRAGTPIGVSAWQLDEPGSDPALQSGRVVFDAGDEPVACAVTQCARRPVAVQPTDVSPYREEELEAIERTILAETRRGSNPRYFEDTAVGESIGPLPKGPLSTIDLVAWGAATQGMPPADHELSEGGIGTDRASGPQRVAWASQLLTDWMGDDAFLHRLSVSLTAAAPVGGMTLWQAEVREKPSGGPPGAVGISLQATNHDDEVIGFGRAVVLLPSRDRGPVSLPLSPLT